MRKNIILFDLDGTILDGSLKYYKIYCELLREKKYEPLSFNKYWSLKRSHTPISIIISKTCSFEFSKKYIKKRLRIIEDRKYLTQDRVIRGAKKTLEKLSLFYSLVLITLRANRNQLLFQLKRLNLLNYFEHILSGSSGNNPIYAKKSLLKRFSELKRAILIVGDTEADIRAGKSLFLKTCAVLSGIRNKNLLDKEKPDHIITDITAVPNIL